MSARILRLGDIYGEYTRFTGCCARETEFGQRTDHVRDEQCTNGVEQVRLADEKLVDHDDLLKPLPSSASKRRVVLAQNILPRERSEEELVQEYTASA
jgi:hypothetical protein